MHQDNIIFTCEMEELAPRKAEADLIDNNPSFGCWKWMAVEKLGDRSLWVSRRQGARESPMREAKVTRLSSRQMSDAGLQLQRFQLEGAQQCQMPMVPIPCRQMA